VFDSLQLSVSIDQTGHDTPMPNDWYGLEFNIIGQAPDLHPDCPDYEIQRPILFGSESSSNTPCTIL
jgi:hypothetical protein